MLLGGDEVGRTQGGNNNAYCQDDEISWFDWADTERHADLHDFVCRLTELRRDHPVFRRRRWFSGRSIRGTEIDDIGWLRPDGEPMSDDDWDAGFARSLGLVLNGGAIPWPGPRGEAVRDDTFAVLLNAHHEDIVWTIPGEPWGEAWQVVVDTATGTASEAAGESETDLKAGDEVDVTARSVMVLRRTR